MSSTMSATTTTCSAMHNTSAMHGSIGLACSHRHAASLSSATTCSTDDFPGLTKEDLPARDSLEIVRKTIAHKRALRNAATLSADRVHVADAADLIDFDDNTFMFGSPLVRMGRRDANHPWDHQVPHKDSLDICRERATSDVDSKRRSLKQRVSTRVRITFADMGATLSRAKSWSSLDGSTPEHVNSVEGRPKIEVMQHTMRKLA